MPHPTLIRYLIVMCWLTLISGCVCPTQQTFCDVSGNVLSRTGHDLGPEKVACEIMVDQWVNWEDGLSEEEAVTIGLWNNPAYQELLADLQIAQADVLQATQLQNPQITTMFPLGPKQWEFALLIPLDAVWLRPIRVAATQLETQRVAERLAQDGLDVVRDVRVAFIDYQLALQQAQLAEHGATLRHEIARIAEARLAAGEVSELEVSVIRQDARLGDGEAARAAYDVELALQRLRFVMGLQRLNVPIHPCSASPPPGLHVNVDQLVQDAVSSRPDLIAVQLAVTAAEQRAELAHRSMWRLTGMLPDINARGAHGFEAGPGLQLTLPVFHQNQGEIAQALADAERLRRQHAHRSDLAACEVRQAYTRLLQAEREREIWSRQILPQAEQAMTSSQRALEEDALSLLLVLETTRQLLTAQRREREADAQYRRALAELERSIGHRLRDGTVDRVPDAEIVPLPSVELRENAS